MPESPLPRHVCVALLVPLLWGAVDHAGAGEVPEPVIQSNHSQPITALLAAPAADLLASGSQDGTVKLWSIRSHQQLRSLAVTTSWIRGLAFDRDAARLAVGTGDHALHVYDVQSGALLRTFDVAKSAVTSLSFGTDGASIQFKGARDSQAFQCRLDVEQPCVGAATVEAAGSSADPGGAAGVATANGALVVWQSNSPGFVAPIDATGLRVIRFSPDDGSIAVGTNAGDLVLWDVESGEARAFERTAIGATSSYASSLAFSADGTRLSAIRGAARDRWDWKLDSVPPVLPPPARDTSGSPGDDYVSWGRDVGAGARPMAPVIAIDGQPTIYTTNFAASAAAAPLTVFAGSTTPLFQAFVSNGQWNVTNGRGGARMYALAVSDDGSAVGVAYGDRTIDVLNAAGQVTRTLRADVDRPFNSLAFSRDGSWVAATTFAGQVMLWPPQATQAIALPPHRGAALSLAFSPDGGYLASGGADAVIQRWNIRTSKPLTSLLGHSSAVTALAFANHRAVLASGSEDGTLRIWNSATGSLLVTAVAPAPDVWLTISPEGFFDGTRAAWNVVPFRFPSRPRDLYRPEQFFGPFFQPGLLGRVITTQQSMLAQLRQHGDPRAARDVAKLANSRPAEIGAGPVTIPADTARVLLKVSVRDAGSGARDLRVFRNQSLVWSKRGDLPVDAATRRFAVNVPVDLAPGPNELSAYVFNRDDVRSDEVVVRVAGPATAAPAVAYVLAIGINEYSNPDFNLKYAAPDAQLVTSTMQASLQALAEFAQVVPITLTNQDATRAHPRGTAEARRHAAAGCSRDLFCRSRRRRCRSLLPTAARRRGRGQAVDVDGCGLEGRLQRVDLRPGSRRRAREDRRGTRDAHPRRMPIGRGARFTGGAPGSVEFPRDRAARL